MIIMSPYSWNWYKIFGDWNTMLKFNAILSALFIVDNAMCQWSVTRLMKKASTFLPSTASTEELHPETPVKRVILVKTLVELLRRCSKGPDVEEDMLIVAYSNLFTDVESIVSSGQFTWVFL